jgi:hypothetical protein
MSPLLFFSFGNKGQDDGQNGPLAFKTHYHGSRINGLAPYALPSAARRPE